VSTGGIVRSSKLSAIEYLRLDEKMKFSLKAYSALFSIKIAPFKKASLEAMKGLTDNLVCS